MSLRCRLNATSNRYATTASLRASRNCSNGLTQFNTTGRKFATAELKALIGERDAQLFSIKVADRFGDHGLVGAAVVRMATSPGW